jgi:hypothetical protein
MTKANVGDRVRFTVGFLRSTGQYSGPEAPTSFGPFARGRVIADVEKMPDFRLVKWDNGRETPVLAANLERCR